MSLSKALFRIGVGLFLCSGSVVLAQGPPAGAGPPGGTPGSPPVPDELTIQVDCSNGDSINYALNTLALDLTIEISGTCIENVVVKADKVTLRGVNVDVGTGVPTDRIQGVPDFGSVILIRDPIIVIVENLILEGNNGVIVVYRSGATADDDDTIVVRNVIMEGTSETDLAVLGASLVIVEDSAVGNTEILNSSALVLRRVELTGRVFARGGVRVALQGVTQNSGIQNTIENDSALFVRCANCMGGAIPSTLGHISVDNLSRALIKSFTELEDLTCSDGSDAFCDGTETKNPPGLNSCGSCP